MNSGLMGKYLVVFFWLLFSLEVFAEVPILVKIENPSDRFFFLSEQNSEKSFRVDLVNDNTASFVFDLECEGFVEFNYAGQQFPIYLENDDNISISFDPSNLLKSINFSGKGSGNNIFINSYLKAFGSLEKSQIEVGYLELEYDKRCENRISSHTASQFNNSEKALLEEKQKMLAAYQGSISNSLQELYSKKIFWDRLVNCTAWMIKNYQFQTSTSVKEALNIFANGIVLNSEEKYLSKIEYKNFLNAKAIFKFLPNDPIGGRVYKGLFETISSNFVGKEKCYMQSHLMVKVYEKSGETTLGRTKIGEFVNVCPYPEYTQQIMEIYGGDISGVENVSAPEIDIVDKDGNLISLSDFNGKVVYISFWASWCKPCIAGFKKSSELRKKLSDMGVVLLNISIDKKEEAWIDSMVRYKPVGVNGRVISLPEVSKSYDISAIPLYHIVDKKGKFTYLSDEAGRNILQEFQILVER